jgi:molecular chaperone DnaK (HSP70)
MSRDRAIAQVASATGMTPVAVAVLNRAVLTTVTGKSFGVATFNKQKREDEVINLIQADDLLPITVTRPVYTVADQQTRVILSVVQNRSRVKGEQHAVSPGRMRGDRLGGARVQDAAAGTIPD